MAGEYHSLKKQQYKDLMAPLEKRGDAKKKSTRTIPSSWWMLIRFRLPDPVGGFILS